MFCRPGPTRDAIALDQLVGRRRLGGGPRLCPALTRLKVGADDNVPRALRQLHARSLEAQARAARARDAPEACQVQVRLENGRARRAGCGGAECHADGLDGTRNILILCHGIEARRGS